MNSVGHSLSFLEAHESSFKMTVKISNMIEIATHTAWLKNLATIFQPMRSRSKIKTKTNRALNALFLSQMEQVTGNCRKL